MLCIVVVIPKGFDRFMWSIYLYPSGLFIDIDMQSILVDSCYTFTHITSLSYLPLNQPCRILTKFRPVQNYSKAYTTWWCHPMGTFSALLALCAGNSPVTGEFPTQRPETRSFDVLLDLRLNKCLSKQPWGWWSETPLCSLWRHCNDIQQLRIQNE